MNMWDMPIEKQAITEAGLPETDAEWRTWQEAQEALGKPGAEGSRGHSEYDPEVWMMGKHAPAHEKYHTEPESRGSGGYYMPGITHPEDLDEDEEYEQEPVDYHVMTGHVDSTDPSEWTEHHYTMFEHPDYDYNPDNAWDFFQQDHPEYNPERNINATHEVKNVHPAENHDEWHRNIEDEANTFNTRIAPTGLQRESPEVPGHRAYRYEEPNGIVHRLWRSPYSSNGPGWVTSHYSPNLERNQQFPWTEHPDSASDDPLGDALAQIRRNRAGIAR
jgi:hypothetical protein